MYLAEVVGKGATHDAPAQALRNWFDESAGLTIRGARAANEAISPRRGT